MLKQSSNQMAQTVRQLAAQQPLPFSIIQMPWMH